MVLAAKALSFTRDKKTTIDGVSLALKKGDFHIILGPNGAGKSTLLKILSGELKASAGEILLHGKAIQDYSLKALSKKRAVLPQLNKFIFPMSVYEVCALGRTPYMGSKLNTEDKKFIDQALSACDLQTYAEKEYSKLSGGEQQRVQIARILCQNTELLLLDEPFSALDIRHQIQLMDLLVGLSQQGKTIVCIMHDINLALRYATELTFLKEGKLLFQGAPHLANQASLYQEVYGVSVSVTQSEKGLTQINWGTD